MTMIYALLLETTLLRKASLRLIPHLSPNLLASKGLQNRRNRNQNKLKLRARAAKDVATMATAYDKPCSLAIKISKL